MAKCVLLVLRYSLMMSVLLALLSGSDVRAQRSPAASPEEVRAREIGREGIKVFNLGDNAKAIELFEEAYRTYPLPTLLYNLAQVHRKQGNYEKALDLYKSYLRTELKISAKERASIEEKIAELEKLVEAQRRAQQSPPEGVRSAPSSQPIAGASPKPTEAPRWSPWYSDPWGWTFVAAGVVGLGVGGGFVAWSSSLRAEADDATTITERNRLYDDADRKRTIGVVSLLGGGALLAAGVVTLVIHAPETSSNITRLDVRVGAGWVTVRGRF